MLLLLQTPNQRARTTHTQARVMPTHPSPPPQLVNLHNGDVEAVVSAEHSTVVRTLAAFDDRRGVQLLLSSSIQVRFQTLLLVCPAVPGLALGWATQ